MDIKHAKHNSFFKNIALLCLLLLALLFLPGLLKKEAKNPETLASDKKTNASAPARELKNLNIEISQKNYQKLKSKRDAAYITEKKGVLNSSDEDLVNTIIRYDEQDYNGRIRLKGDWIEHLEGDTWSFRVKLDPEQTINGMRKFSLQHPQTRNYAGEWLFHELLKNDDVLHLRYDFVNVTLTIKDNINEVTKELGVYALEEFFDKQLIEHNRRREGILLKIDEDPLWKERSVLMGQQVTLEDLQVFKLAKLKNLNILPFNRKRVYADSTLQKQFLTAKYLFESFIDGKLPISEVFDVEKLANFNAICNILGANHALYHHNYRVYYNPINSRLEPIGFDADAIKKTYYFEIYLHAFEDQNYSKAYMAALERVTSDDYFDKILNWPGLASHVQLLKKAYPKYQFKEEFLHFNRKVIRSFLFPVKSLNIFLEKADGKSITMSIANFNRYPAEVLGLSNAANRHFGSLSSSVIIPPNTTEVVTFKLDKNYQRLFINKKKNKTGLDLSQDLKDIKVDYRTLGTSKKGQGEILEWPDDNTSISETDIFRREPNVESFDFLVVDSTAKTITCKTGTWGLTGLMHIPPGYTFVMKAGTSIELKSVYASIISFSPVHFLGTTEAPVSIYSNALGKGLIIMNTRDTSIIRHCKFDNLSTVTTEGWAVSGAVNFYDAPVKMFNCSFTKNRSEDALNIISSWFEMDNVVFQDIKADAFDGDFVAGIIKNTIFNNIGNDAIDVSGSELQVENVHISNAGDKGLSAGEESTLLAKDIVIKGSAIAVASKDKSVIKISNCLLENNQLALTAFKKKPEYGAAVIEGDSMKLVGNRVDYLIETGSRLLLNGSAVKTVDRVAERMYGVEFGRSSN